MIRKTIIAIAAAATLALGLGAATAPAEAGHRRAHIGIYIGTPHLGFYGHRGHRHGHCHIVRVKKHYGWKRVKRCHGHRHSGGHHY